MFNKFSSILFNFFGTFCDDFIPKKMGLIAWVFKDKFSNAERSIKIQQKIQSGFDRPKYYPVKVCT